MSNFKDIAKKNQIKFKKDVLNISELGFFEKKIVHPKTKEVIEEKRKIPSPNFLPELEWKNGLNYTADFRKEIEAECKGFNNKMRDANILRSEHIPLNFFVPMRNYFSLTKELFNSLLGNDFIETITAIHIEIAGGKSKKNYDKSKYLNDGTSFDARIDFIHKDGGNGYLGIEVKYTEGAYKIKPNSKEYKDIWNRKNALYQIVSDKSNYYIGNKYDELKHDEFRQIWRNHILGAAIIQSGNEIDHFYHIHLYPQGNEHFEKTIPEYQKLLSERGKETFIPITYETFFSVLEKIFIDNETQEKWVKYLKRRYLFN